MGKYIDRFKNQAKKMDNRLSTLETKERVDLPPQQKERLKETSADAWTDMPEGDMFPDEMFDDKNDPYNDNVNITPAQKPESFHHFILENQYKDLERSIRGFKDVFNKDTQTWEIKRKEEHCFTDEEAEEILRTAQSHLATDIKLSFISKISFPLLMDAIYKQLSFIFRSIAEYRYGRYRVGGKPSYEKQYEMKVENLKIFLELITRIQANYSRAIQGTENKNTHQSVKTQESLQGDRFNDPLMGNRRWS
jgi:Sec-independent protein translocase protein TatA